VRQQVPQHLLLQPQQEAALEAHHQTMVELVADPLLVTTSQRERLGDVLNDETT
jgi:hypothetical protein